MCAASVELPVVALHISPKHLRELDHLVYERRVWVLCEDLAVSPIQPRSRMLRWTGPNREAWTLVGIEAKLRIAGYYREPFCCGNVETGIRPVASPCDVKIVAHANSESA